MIGSQFIVTTSAASAPTAVLRVLDLDADHAQAALGNMLLVVWHRETKLDAFKRVAEHMRAISRAHDGGVGLLHLVSKGAVPPDSDTKREFLSLMATAEGHVKHYSVVHEATGFSAAIFRALVSGVYLFAQPRFAHNAFSSLAEAAAWHVQQQKALGQASFDEAALVSALQSLEARVATFAES